MKKMKQTFIKIVQIPYVSDMLYVALWGAGFVVVDNIFYWLCGGTFGYAIP